MKPPEDKSQRNSYSWSQFQGSSGHSPGPAPDNGRPCLAKDNREEKARDKDQSRQPGALPVPLLKRAWLPVRGSFCPNLPPPPLDWLPLYSSSNTLCWLPLGLVTHWPASQGSGCRDRRQRLYRAQPRIPQVSPSQRPWAKGPRPSEVRPGETPRPEQGQNNGCLPTTPKPLSPVAASSESCFLWAVSSFHRLEPPPRGTMWALLSVA